jgi:predicted component of type VI protein secretion system
MADPSAPHTASPTELKARIEAERAGLPFLVVRDGDGRQRIVVLGDATQLTVGREPACDVALDWDTEVSSVHAELARVGVVWTIADDGLSRNGTFVNGRRVTGRLRLRDGDVIHWGATDTVFRAPAAAEPAATDVATSAPSAAELSPAQRRVLIALCRPFKAATGHGTPATNQQIADELVVSVDAVKANLRALFDKFEVGDLAQNRKRARLVELALKSGAVTLREL